ncbi:MAG: DMT family transporter [Bacteroidales bacterium]|nr:DMT family transporter [Bacteroidales bacterium]
MGLRFLKVYLYSLLAMLFWGLSFVWFKQVVVQYQPITIIWFRLLVSSGLLLLFLFVTKKLEFIHNKDIKWFLLLAFTQPFCYFLGESFGLSLVSSTVSAVIISTIPLFSPIAAYFILKETVSRDVILGIVVSFIGILIMLINPDFSISASPKGILLLFFAVLAAVAYSVVIKKLAFNYRPATIILLQNSIGMLYFLPLFLIFDLKAFLLIQPQKEVLFAFFELTIFASTLSYLFYIISIKEIGVVKSNVLTNLIPIFTAIFSYFILEESFTFAKISGMGVVMIGIIVSQYKSLFQRLKRSKLPETQNPGNKY